MNMILAFNLIRVSTGIYFLFWKTWQFHVVDEKNIYHEKCLKIYDSHSAFEYEWIFRLIIYTLINDYIL